MPCTTLCSMLFQSELSHENCECECHVGFYVPGYSAIDQVVDERNALRDEIAEQKRKLAEVEGERDALLALNAEMLAALNGYAYGIKSCGHNFVCICNQVKAEAIIAKIEGREINPWLRNSPAK